MTCSRAPTSPPTGPAPWPCTRADRRTCSRSSASAGRWRTRSCWTAPRSSSRWCMQGTDERWMVLLANRRAARLFFGPGDALEETDRLVDDVHQQHDQGRLVAVQLPALGRQGGLRPPPERRRPRVRRSTRSRARTACCRRAGRAAHRVQEQAAPVPEGADRRARSPSTSRTRRWTTSARRRRPRSPRTSRAASARRWTASQQGVGTGGRGAAGIAEVLDALNQARVETLLISENFRAAGRVDFQAGLLLPEGAEQRRAGRRTSSSRRSRRRSSSPRRDGRAPPRRSGAARRHRGGASLLKIAFLGTGIMGAPMARNLRERRA